MDENFLRAFSDHLHFLPAYIHIFDVHLWADGRNATVYFAKNVSIQFDLATWAFLRRNATPSIVGTH